MDALMQDKRSEHVICNISYYKGDHQPQGTVQGFAPCDFPPQEIPGQYQEIGYPSPVCRGMDEIIRNGVVDMWLVAEKKCPCGRI